MYNWQRSESTVRNRRSWRKGDVTLVPPAPLLEINKNDYYVLEWVTGGTGRLACHSTYFSTYSPSSDVKMGDKIFGPSVYSVLYTKFCAWKRDKTFILVSQIRESRIHTATQFAPLSVREWLRQICWISLMERLCITRELQNQLLSINNAQNLSHVKL